MALNRLNDTKEILRLSRLLSDKAIGPKRRDFTLGQDEKPTWQDWGMHVSQPGYDGGWEASVVDESLSSRTDPIYHWPKEWDSTLDSEDSVNLFDLPSVLKGLHRVKNGRAVPEHSCPKEI